MSTDDWTMDHGYDGTYPFVEDENANITGLGHQDKATFAAKVNEYERRVCGMDDAEPCEAEQITHTFAVLGPDGESLLVVRDNEPVTSDTPGAIAITALWWQR